MKRGKEGFIIQLIYLPKYTMYATSFVPDTPYYPPSSTTSAPNYMARFRH